LTQYLALPADRLVVTYFGGNDAVPADLEAKELWKDIAGLPEERIVPLGEKDNFWAMGDSGPCGPCTEIYFDLDPSQGPACTLVADDGRYMEVWNCVFMQYDRQEGVLSPLPAPCVDTGMGLERIASVVQGAQSNYDTDLFLSLIETTQRLSGGQYGGRFDPENVVSGNADIEQDVAYRVIADHARATAFLIAEGIYPDSEGRGYVLRRIMRRAIRFGRKIGMSQPFLCVVAAQVCDLLGEVFPELLVAKALVEKLARQEEERFGQTLESGEKLIAAEIERKRASGDDRVLAGDLVFLLHDTHGFPTDLTALIAAEQGFSIDAAGFAEAMQAQKARGKASWKKGSGDLVALGKELAEQGITTEFVGYEQTNVAAKVLALVVDGQLVAKLGAGEEGLVVLDRTPMYGEGGGQTGDQGSLLADGLQARVLDTQKTAQGIHLHRVALTSGALVAGQTVVAQLAADRRAAIAAHHSATHLLHKALRDVLGPHVKQRGSLVLPDRLRFDFSHYAPMSDSEIAAVEQQVARAVLANAAAEVELTSMDVAVQKGAMAFFGDKYGDVVRVLTLGDSIELCGGTHVHRTGDIGAVLVVSESAVSAGVRRLEAVCHLAALQHIQSQRTVLDGIARKLGTSAEQVPDRLEKMQDQLKAGQQEVEKWKTKALQGGGGQQGEERLFGSTKAVFRVVDDAESAALRNLSDQIRDQMGDGVVCLLSKQPGDKALLLVAVTKTRTEQLQAGPLVAALAPILGGRGGGRADFAQAGGQFPADTAAFAEAFFAAVAAKLV
jgi:alanyl-tRNA synthetase